MKNHNLSKRSDFSCFFIHFFVKMDYCGLFWYGLPAIEIKPYYYKTQMEKIKAVHAQITGNIKARYTIEALSVMYEISATTMKKCFKDVYGDSIDRLHRRERTKDGDIGHPLRDQRGMRTCAVLLHLPWRGSVSKVYGRGSHAGDRPLVSVCAFVL